MTGQKTTGLKIENAFMKNIVKIIFPPSIDIFNVSQYIEASENLINSCFIVFDMKATEYVHSSFIGFMIHFKTLLKKKGGRLILQFSPSLTKTFRMMNIHDYFAA